MWSTRAAWGQADDPREVPVRLTRVVSVVIALGVALCVSAARADVFVIDDRAATEVRVDGVLREWTRPRGDDAPTRLLAGNTSDAAVVMQMATSGDAMLFAFELRDDRVVRTAQCGEREDAILVAFGSERARVDVRFCFGVAGVTAGGVFVSMDGGPERRVDGASMVESAEGATTVRVEARVPVRALGSPRARIALAYRDVDAEARPVPETIARSADLATPSTWHHTVTRGPNGDPLVDAWIERGVGPSVYDACAGIAASHSCLFRPQELLLAGPRVRDGRGWLAYAPPDPRDRIARVVATMLLGDPLPTFALDVVREIEGTRVTRVEVLRWHDERLVPVLRFVREVLRGGATFEQPVLEARISGAPALRFARTASAEAPLLPGEAAPTGTLGLVSAPVVERLVVWNGSAFTVREQREAPNAAPVPRAPPTQVEPPRAAGMDAFAAFLDAFPAYRASPAGPVLRADLAGDARLEEVRVYGTRVVVAGPGFLDGEHFVFFDLPIPREGALVELTSQLVDAGRQHALLARVRQPIGDVTRELVFVHRVREAGAQRLGAIEVRRAQGEANVIESQLVVEGSGPTRHFEVRGARARGWTRETYPFLDEAEAGVHPIALPWSDSPRRSFVVRGDAIERVSDR